MPSALNRKSLHFLAFLLPASLLLFLSVYKLDYFGLDYDELLFVNAALGDLDGATFVQQKWGKVVIIVFNYIGALKSWLYIPIFKAFSVDAWSVRLPMVALLFVNLFLTYKIALRYFGQTVAYAVFLLLTVDLSFITLHRLDKGPSAVETCIKLLVIVMFARPHGFRKYLIIMLLMVLGVFNKLNFLWFINALYGVVFLMNIKDVKALITRKLTIKEFLNTVIGHCSVGFFLLFCGYIGYIKFLGLHPAAPPHTIKDILFYFTLQLKMLKYTILSTRIFYLFGWDLRSGGLQLFGNLLLVGTVLANIYFYVRRKVAYRSFHSALGLLILIMFIQVVLTVEASSAWHTFMLYPFLHIFIVHTVYLLSSEIPNMRSKILWGFVGIWFVANMFIQYEFNKRVLTECISGELFIPQMSELISYTKQRPENKILSVSWGVNAPMLVTGEGKKTYLEPFHATFSPPHLNKWYEEHRKELAHPDSILLVTYVMEQTPVYGKVYIVRNDSAFRRYERMIRTKGQEPYLHNIIRNQCGKPVYEIYKLKFLGGK
jgi:hypothetical protein